MEIIVKDIQTWAGWQTHTQADGSNIGGVPPAKYGFLQGIPDSSTAMLFYVEGSTVPGGYADWEAYRDTPVLPNTGNLQLDFNLTVDEKAAQYAQAIEIDTILCIAGLKYNFSFQVNYAEGGEGQIVSKTGAWVNLGDGAAKLMPGIAHHFTLRYAFDTTQHLYSFAWIEIDGATYAIADALKNLPAVPTDWKDGAMLQVQQDLNALAGGFSMTLDNMQYTWS